MALTPRGAKTLPLNISEEPGRYTVRVRRGRVTYRASVSKASDNALVRAIQVRDEFLIVAGPMRYPKGRKLRAPLSNTGIRGITDYTKWVQYRPRHCIQVGCFGGGGPTVKRFYYGARSRPRSEAVRLAVAYRSMRMEVSHA